jgi:flagellar M-ring protein FliF
MATPKEMASQVGSMMGGLGAVQKILVLGFALAVLVGLVALSMSSGKLQYKVLYSGLTEEDAAAVVAQLQEERKPYRLSEDGRAILVPAAQVYEVRLALAGQGLPRGGGVGFEIFDKTNLGTTDYVQRLNYQRALQGELARTIRRFDQVAEARVHIATPRESVFIEDAKPPSASISVQLKGREKLAKDQIQAVVNLVASAVPGLTPENITLVDTTGRLLYRKQGEAEGMLSASQLEYQLKIESTLRQKVETMLEEVVGVGRAMVRVTAEMDFTRVNLTEEIFDPESQVARSEQQSEEQDSNSGDLPAGIPGVKGELATFAEAGEAGGAGSSAKRTNVTRNYEINKTTRQVQQPVGVVKRLSVAAMVDGIYEKGVDKDGKPSQAYKVRSPEDMQYFEKLVKNAIGYSEERADQVEVINMAFAQVPEIEVAPPAMDKWRDLLEPLAMPLVYLLVAFGALVFLVRPVLRFLTTGRPVAHPMRTMAPASAGGGMDFEVGEDIGFAPKAMSDRERMYKLAQSDPDRAADLVKRWLREEQ